MSGTATPNALAATNLWRNSVRTIGDILLLSDIVKPMAYLALPFVNQALYAAACCHIKGQYTLYATGVDHWLSVRRDGAARTVSAS